MMGTERLLQKLSAMVSLSGQFQDTLSRYVRAEQYKAHQVLYATGQMDTRIAYIETGLARNYYFDSDGKEHTTRFWDEGQIIFSHEGFRIKPSIEYLEFLEAATLLTLTYTQLFEVLSHLEETGPIVNLIDQEFRETDMMRNRLLTMPAEDRYKQYRHLNPQIFRRVPLRFIASYLNLTREGLSRIMSRK